jgi:hypothetical protein
MTWLAGYSLDFPSNFGISEGSLVGILGHVALCNIGSFVHLLKSGMLRDAKYGMGGGDGGLVPTWCEQIVDLTLEGNLVGLYFSLKKQFSLHLLARED